MINLPIEIWIYHILPKIDDITLFNLIESGVCIEDTLFWKKRIDTEWVINTVIAVTYSAESYSDIVNEWNKFIKPFTSYELLYAEKGCPCNSPYHICVLGPPIKPVLCMPNYIRRDWVEKQDVQIFNTMRDILNWRCR